MFEPLQHKYLEKCKPIYEDRRCSAYNFLKCIAIIRWVYYLCFAPLFDESVRREMDNFYLP